MGNERLGNGQNANRQKGNKNLLVSSNKLSASLRQSHTNLPNSNAFVPMTGTSVNSPLSSSITPSLFHSRLKTFLFHKSFPPKPFSFSELSPIRRLLPSARYVNLVKSVHSRLSVSLLSGTQLYQSRFRAEYRIIVNRWMGHRRGEE